MNAPFTPVDSHNAFDEWSRLLAVMADPATHKKRLEELNAAEVAAKERIAELHAMQAETVRLNTTAKATNIVADNRIKAVEAREAEADAREARLDTKGDAALGRRESAAEAKENGLVRREAAVAKREAAADARDAKHKSYISTL
jgi:hypothetical protein